MQLPATSERFFQQQNRAALWRLGWMALILAPGIMAILSLNLLRGNLIEVQEGMPAAQSITAHFSRPYPSPILTEQARVSAAARVADVYTPLDREIGRNRIELARALMAYIKTVRDDQAATAEWKRDALAAVSAITITPAVADLLLDLSAESLTQVEQETVAIIDELMRREIRDSQNHAIPAAVQSAIRFGISARQEAVLTATASQLIVPNTFYDEAATRRAREQARIDVPEVENTILQGEIVLREGDIVRPIDIEVLEQLGLLQRQASWWDILRNALLTFLATAVLILYLYRYREICQEARRYTLFFGVIFLLQLLGAALLISPGAGITWLLPASALAMLIAVIYEPRLAIIATMVIAGLSGYIGGNSLEIAIYVVAGSLLAVLSLRDAQRISALFRAGLLAAAGNLIVIAIFHIGPQADWLNLLSLAGYAIGSGVLAAALALLGFFVAGPLFGITTLVQLQELSRFDQPLLKRLLHVAPGTYHHSIIVANLAEQAAEQIGANSLLARVGAFYHDIGKMTNAPWFSENQEDGNPHEQLDPYASAELIISHVADGIREARQHGLPSRIQDFIREHHGDYLVRYFYKKALDVAGGNVEQVDESRFHYHGPRPRSREAGIVMMADSVEATSKAVQPNTVRAIEKLVFSITDDLLNAHQLDDSGLSLRDIRLIRESFIETLQGRFHVRVKYAGNEALEAENAVPPR